MPHDRLVSVSNTDPTPNRTAGGAADGDVVTWVTANGRYEPVAPTGGGAPTTVDYLVGTAQAGLSAEIVVGATPGGELGGTWASPTVDATHGGSAHHAESHNTRHVSGGADAVKLDDLAAPDDNTDLNATTGAHGLLKKLSGTSTQYMGGDGNWTTPYAFPTFIGCVITEGTAQSLTNNVAAAVTSNDAEVLDTDGYHSTASDTSRITIPTGLGGWYDVRATLFYAANGTGYRETAFRVNASVDEAGYDRRTAASAAIGTYVSTAAYLFMAAGAYVELWAQQGSGGALNVFMSRFSLRFVGV